MKSRSMIKPFVIISLSCISLTALLLGWITSTYLTKSLLEREELVTVRHLERLARDGLSVDELRDLGSDESRKKIADIGRQTLRLPEAVRVKIFDSDGTIVWSDEPALIGVNSRDDSGVQKSLAGNVVVSLETITPTAEHTHEAAKYSHLTSIYAPIVDFDTGKVLAVFEVYKVPDLLLATIHRGQVILWSISLAGGCLLFLAQFVLVRGAASTIGKQNLELERRALALEATNAELKATQGHLVEAERLAAIGEITVAVAHGIRNPLANIRAIAQDAEELLRSGEPAGNALEEIIREADRLENRLRKFLGANGAFQLNPSDISIDDLVSDALKSMSHDLRHSGAETCIAPTRLKDSVRWDGVKMGQAIQEILTNSIEAGAKTIWIDCLNAPSNGRPSVDLKIDDDGEGLKPATENRVLERFFTTKGHGTGMGLPSVRRIVEAHGGTVFIKPRVAGGTSVCLHLPVQVMGEEE